ncbi:MAG: hypothetical protein JW723_11300 [Bacteroidales bacterium]|nr:hypothetical protein [Bacteroidales bacterium]
MFQSGHSLTAKEYHYVTISRKMVPARPVINGESRHENNVGFKPWATGRGSDFVLVIPDINSAFEFPGK